MNESGNELSYFGSYYSSWTLKNEGQLLLYSMLVNSGAAMGYVTTAEEQAASAEHGMAYRYPYANKGSTTISYLFRYFIAAASNGRNVNQQSIMQNFGTAGRTTVYLSSNGSYDMSKTVPTGVSGTGVNTLDYTLAFRGIGAEVLEGAGKPVDNHRQLLQSLSGNEATVTLEMDSGKFYQKQTAGLIGQIMPTENYRTPTIQSLNLTGSVAASTYAGAMIGRDLMSRAQYVDNTVTDMNVTATGATSYAGGLIGATDRDTLEVQDIGVKGSTITAATAAGGVVGLTRFDRVEQNTSYGFGDYQDRNSNYRIYNEEIEVETYDEHRITGNTLNAAYKGGVVGELVDTYRSSGLHIYNLDLRGNSLTPNSSGTGTVLGWTAATDSNSTHKWGVYGYNIFDGISENIVGTSDTKTELAAIQDAMMGFDPADGSKFDSNFVWFLKILQLETDKINNEDSTKQEAALNYYYPDALARNYRPAYAENSNLSDKDLYFWRYDTEQNVMTRLNGFYEILHRGSFVSYLDAGPTEEKQSVPSSLDYIRYTTYSPSAQSNTNGSGYFYEYSREASIKRSGGRFYLYNQDGGGDGRTVGTYYLTRIDQRDYITDRYAYSSEIGSSETLHVLSVQDGVRIQIDAPIYQQETSTLVAEGDQHFWLPNTGNVDQGDIEGRFKQYLENYGYTDQGDATKTWKTLVDKYHANDTDVDDVIFITEGGMMTSYITMAYSGTRLDWSLSAMPTETLRLVNTEDTTSGSMKYTTIPQGTVITMYHLEKQADGSLKKTEYRYTANAALSGVALTDFTNINTSAKFVIPNVGRTTRTSEEAQFAQFSDETIIDTLADIERYFFVFDFSEVSDTSGLEASDCKKWGEGQHIKTLITQDEPTVAFNPHATGNEYTKASKIHVLPSRYFEFSNTSSVNLENETVVLDQNSEVYFSQEVPLRIQTTLTDHWTAAYDFAADRQNQAFDGSPLYLDVGIYLWDETTNTRKELPNGTGVTLFVTTRDAATGDVLSIQKMVGLPQGGYEKSTYSNGAVYWWKDQRDDGDQSFEEVLDTGPVYNLKTEFETAKANSANSVVTDLDVMLNFESVLDFEAQFGEDLSNYYLVFGAMRSADPRFPYSDEEVATLKVKIGTPTSNKTGLALTADRWELVKRKLDNADTSSYTGIPMTAEFVGMPTNGVKYELRFFVYRFDEATNGYTLVSGENLTSQFSMTDSGGAALDTRDRDEYFYYTLPANTVEEKNQLKEHNIENFTLTPKVGVETSNYRVVCQITVDNTRAATDYLIFRAEQTLDNRLVLRGTAG